MQKNTLFIASAMLLIGFVSAYFIFGTAENKNSFTSNQINNHSETEPLVTNPFAAVDDSVQKTERLNYLENELSLIKKQLFVLQKNMQQTKEILNTTSSRTAASNNRASDSRNRYPSALTQRLYKLDHLIKGGIDASVAEDIVRRKNSIELKRLTLQDRATRENYLDTQQYYDELADINKRDTSLREELGDERYDKYLFDSKQNNRIRISSVMLGSSAEQAGIQKGDIVLSYDNNRIFRWQELKDATTEGQLGEYISISIYRNGEVYSFSVPRGPLGMELGATRLEP